MNRRSTFGFFGLSLGLALHAGGQSGVINTIAGVNWTYPAGVTAALNAPLGTVGGVATDSQGNVYVSDLGNDRIFLIAPGGGIQNIAGNGIRGSSGDGGPAASASLALISAYPGVSGIAVDALGEIFIADSNNFRVRKVSASGIITTVAGSGNYGFSGDGGLATSASLSQPVGVAVDASGNLFIADVGNNRIRKVSASGIITTVAGGGSGGLGDGGPATAASLNSPVGIAVDASGNLFIADYANGLIRKVSVSGTISSVVGGGVYPPGTAIVGIGDGGPATLAAFSSLSVAVDASENLYVSDENNERIRKVSAGGIITTVAGSGPGYPYGAFSGDGGPATAALLYTPNGVAVDALGDLFIADSGNERVRKVSAGGIISTLAGNGNYSFSGDGGSAALAAMNWPTNVAVDASGDVFVSDSGNRRVRKVSASGVITTVAGNGNPGFSGDGGPATSASLNFYAGNYCGIAVDASGDLFIADIGNARIREVSAGGIITTVAGNGSTGFSGDGGLATLASLHAFDVTVDAAGNLYFPDPGSNRIRKVSASGIITTVAGNGALGFAGDGGPATSAALNDPVSIAMDGAGNIFFSDYGNNRIRKVSAAGVITTVAGNGASGFSGDGGAATLAALKQPWGVAVDAAGNLYIADYDNNRIRKVSASGIITTVAGNGTQGFSGDGGTATSANLRYPTGVAVDASGNLFIVDDLNGRIREVLAGNSSANQAITFGALNNITFGVAPFAIAATASSGLTVSFASTTLSVCTVTGTTVTIVGGGVCSITATQAGNSTFAAALPVTVSFTVNAAVGAPAITPGGIGPLFSSSTTIQAGSSISIYGTNLASTAATWNGDFPTSLGGVTVTIDGRKAYLYAVSPTQINLQAPDDTATGSVSVTVTNASGSWTSTVTLAPFGPSFSLYDATHVAGIILRFDGSGAYGGGTYDLIGPTGVTFGYPHPAVAAKQGDSVVLFGVGFGPTSPTVPAGEPFSGAASTTSPVQLTIGTTTVTPSFAGIGFAGLYQINLTIPAGAGTGDLSLAAAVGGVSTPSGRVISLR